MYQLKTITTLGLLITTLQVMSQVKGNYDYRTNSSMASQRQIPIDHNFVHLNLPALGDLTFSIKGMYNASADSYLAIFTSTQVGETQKEANDLLKSKIDSIRQGVKQRSSDVEMFVDMI